MTASEGFLGVDGGGTKTRFVLIDGEGRALAKAQLGPAYHPQVGIDGVRRVLAEGVAQVLADAGMEADAVRYAFFGIPAYGEDSQLKSVLDAMPADALGHARYRCDNDMVCGWAGALGCADGINIVAGTGSMSYGQRNGEFARAGGWGEIFSDEGSAYWIGKLGLNAYSRMSDGRMPSGPLHAHFKRMLELEHDLDLCALVYGHWAGGRGQVARVSMLVAQAARLGDRAALRIYDEAGVELAQLADAARRTLGFEPDEPVPVSYSGGAYEAGDLLLKPFAAALAAAHPNFRLQAPLHEPDYGAALYALKLAAQAG